MSVFEERGKPEYPEKKPLGAREKPTTKLNPHMASTPGFEDGQYWWEASTPPLHHPCSPNNVMRIFNDNVAFYCYSQLSCYAQQSFLPQGRLGVIFVKSARRKETKGFFGGGGRGGGGGG